MVEVAHARSERDSMCFVHPGRTSPFKIPRAAFVRFVVAPPVLGHSFLLEKKHCIVRLQDRGNTCFAMPWLDGAAPLLFRPGCCEAHEERSCV